MLIVTRKTNESITIEPLGTVDPEMTLGEAFQNGPIEIKLVRINRSRVRLAIDAPAEFQVWRGKQDEASLGPIDSSHYEAGEMSVEFDLAAEC
jgi:sRNA-binding carbon storage regulator CsrA